MQVIRLICINFKYRFEWLKDFTSLPRSETVDDKGRTHVYTWQNKLPLHGGEKAIEVNWLQYQLKNAQGKITYTYTNSWVSDIESQQAMLS